MKSSKWINSAARRRCHAKFRRNLCLMLGRQVDCCCTTGELVSELRRARIG